MGPNKEKVLIFTYTDIRRDSIVLHQVKWLKELYDLYVVCAAPGEKDKVNYILYPQTGFIIRNSRNILPLLGMYKKYTWSNGHKELAGKLSGIGFSLIITHHLKLLPVAFAITPRAKVLFYAHEYYMRMYDHSFLWKLIFRRYFMSLASEYINKCAHLITVNESIANLYQSEYSIKTGYIHNTVDYEKIEPSETKPGNIKLLHHGLASTSRKIEMMIELMKYLDKRFTLTLVLQSNSVINDFYIRKLKKKAADNARIKFSGLVEFDEIVKMGNKFDIGLFFMPPTTINIELSLGHKVFQYIQSRLMLAVSPLPEMKKIVEEYDIGIVSGDYNVKKLAERLNALDAGQIMYYKQNACKAASAVDSEMNRGRFLEIISSIINSNMKGT